MRFPIKELKSWFQENKRDLPWREKRDPYCIWVSEVMLQQTGANVVIPYFLKWMERFPDMATLAKASENEVVKMWEGLGYYSRAINLHRGAKYCVKHFSGKLPEGELAKIKGIGPYTQGAILNFAFHKKAAAVDGNVLRVMARFFAIVNSIDSTKTKREIEKHVLQILPEKEPWIISEALIELGATVCQKKASCAKCPLRKECLGLRNGKVALLPMRSQKNGSIALQRAVAVIVHEGKFLLKKGKRGEVMGELYEFPYIEIDKKWTLEDIQKAFEKKLKMKLSFKKELAQERHSFTKYRVTLFPLLFSAKNASRAHLWHQTPQDLPFSSGMRRILQRLA